MLRYSNFYIADVVMLRMRMSRDRFTNVAASTSRELRGPPLQKRGDAFLVIGRAEALRQCGYMRLHVLADITLKPVPDEILHALQRER